MTNERAIELLNRISDSQFDGIHGDERREALEMAVRALESNLVKESGDLVKDLVKDCISREAAIDAVNKLVEWYKEKWHESRPTSESVIDVLNNLPSAQPVKKGKWIDDIVSYSDTGDIILANCSLCGYQMDVVYEHGYFKYCPNCGARMEGESDDQ